MIRHIVMFKISVENKNRISELKNNLDQLKNKISIIKHLETGINLSDRPVAYDLVLITDFESVEDLNRYRDHPEHQKVVDLINEIKDNIVVVDYEKKNF